MEFQISREHLVKLLQPVMGVVSKKQQLNPIQEHVLISIADSVISLTAADSEVEWIGRVPSVGNDEQGDITVPGRKLMDICRTLPDDALIKFQVKENKVTLTSGRGRFVLSTLPSSSFPSLNDGAKVLDFTMQQRDLYYLIERTKFAIAVQDVRYYLNGLLFELDTDSITTVSTNGHRLAVCKIDSIKLEKSHQVIVPRKGILELGHILKDTDDAIQISITSNHIQFKTDDFTFTTVLIDGRFPDYRKVIGNVGTTEFTVNRESLLEVLRRVSVLVDDRLRAVRIQLTKGMKRIFSNNPEQEQQAEEELNANYSGDDMELGFNVDYLIDVLNTTISEEVKFTISDPNASVLIEEVGASDSRYIIMPMKL